jgi:hypothetical protein
MLGKNVKRHLVKTRWWLFLILQAQRMMWGIKMSKKK